ncbi:OLC1v1036567C1 [Oldenlandia corymbosa var. corymbosa]|uniref:OLC1v1036567C1 n=1 Tax=Oldenlandia corymbosa var. corymbosa TaxID=529605 RepID=A0AAV1CYX2_OLDCO|nr:OLC1v1036567C1 [Oldenlandia corymbosa var. corymbosa]
MSSSALISCIQSAIDDLDFLIESHSQIHQITHFGYWTLRSKLRNIKMFVHSTTTFDNHDNSLGSLLVTTEADVRRIAEEIQRLRLHFDCLVDPLLKSQSSDILKLIEPIMENIDEWYLTMFDDETRFSASLTKDQIFEIFATCLENLQELHLLRIDDELDIFQALEALEEKLAFLKNLICFATNRTVDPIKDLLSHSQTVAIRAAYLVYACRSGSYKPAGFRLETSTFLQKMKLIEEIHETYSQTLSSLKSSGFAPHALHQDMDDDDSSSVMLNVLDYLISCLWKLLTQNSYRGFVVKDQLQEMFERLRSLRTILKQQPEGFRMEVMEDIVGVVCDAGVLTFSCCQTELTEVGIGIQDLLRRILDILVKFGDNDRVSTFNFPKTDPLGFVDFVLERLSKLTSCRVEPTIKGCLQTIQEELASLRLFLGEIAGLRNTHNELQNLWNRVSEVAYRVEDLIDHLMVGDLPDTSSILKDIESVKEDVLKTNHSKWGEEAEVKEVNTTIGYRVPEQRSPSISNEVVGFVHEESSIMDRLTRGSKQLRIIVIVGMPGAGKTTLASKVYNDISVASYFSVRSWFPISQVVDKKKILIELLTQIDPNYSYSEMTEYDLADKLRRTLKRRKYLIFLDDVWHIEAWNSLKESFPDDYVGSRIILTSRHHDVAPRSMLDEEPLSVQPLDKENSLKLLKSKLVCQDACSPPSSDLLKQIAECCKGLPLTIVIVAGILSGTEMEGWDKILDSLTSGIEAITEHCKNTLDLSYRHLPDYLKPCLLYFGAFQEDAQVSAKKLFQLWIAEGFVRKQKMKRVQDVAKDFLNALISRSLIIVSNRRWDGGVKSCRIHDLILDFCVQKAKDEQFLHILKGQDELLAFNEPQNLRRLCIFSDSKSFKESKLFCPRARSLLFNYRDGEQLDSTVVLDMSCITRNFKLLRVLDIEQIDIGRRFPSEIELLVQLAFLAIRGHMSLISPFIGKLSNLETLIADPCGSNLSLPSSLWNLQNLKNLYIRGRVASGRLPLEDLDSPSVLYELDRLSGVCIPLEVNIEKLMRKFPDIRKLKCNISVENQDSKYLYKIVIPDFLSQLESISVSGQIGFCGTVGFCFPAHLRKLSLSDFVLSGRLISAFGELPNLEVLKMIGVKFEEGTWELNEGEFSKLRFLSLASRDLIKWRACDDQFECLQILVLHACTRLEEMPSCLESVSTLETIEIYDCSKTVEKLVREIAEEQENYGNPLRIIIQ